MNEQTTNSSSGEKGFSGQEERPMENNVADNADTALPNGFEAGEGTRTPTPRRSLQSSRSLSLGSLSEVRDFSQDEASRSRIGRDSMLGGGVPLSPIPRSSEVGLHIDDKKQEEKEEPSTSSNGKEPAILEEQEDLSERIDLADESNSCPETQEAPETNDNLQNETITLPVNTNQNAGSTESSNREEVIQKDNRQNETNTSITNQNATSTESVREEAIQNDHPQNETTSLHTNQNAVSMQSNREEAIQMAQRAAGAASVAFLQGIRTAAHQRNMGFSRTRDSIVAKEEERRLEAERNANQKQESSKINSHEDNEMFTSHHEFHARPLPKSTRMGGLSGLPKVAKRPVTTAHTPKVASRRSSMHVTAKQKSKIFEEGPEQKQFRARPLPTATMNQGSLSGVPKVPKRPLTVPFSPLLGARRPRASQRRHSVAVGIRSQRTPTSFSTTTISNESTPLGLQFLSDSAEDRENSRPDQTVRTNRAIPEFKEFKLQSTIRAQKRAVYDETQKERREEEKKKERREIEVRIKRLDRQLGELKWKL